MFEPRDYQKAFCDAFKSSSKKRFMAVWPRRAGKTFCAWQMCLNELKEDNRLVHWISPTYWMGRRSLWEGYNNESKPFFNSISAATLEALDGKKMFYHLKNGSFFQLFSSEKYASPLKPTLIIIDEPALCHPNWVDLLDATDAKIILVGTPRPPTKGPYFFRYIYEKGVANKDEWFVSHLTIDDTKHIDKKEIDQGEMLPDLADEEYFTIFKDD